MIPQIESHLEQKTLLLLEKHLFTVVIVIFVISMGYTVFYSSVSTYLSAPTPYFDCSLMTLENIVGTKV